MSPVPEPHGHGSLHGQAMLRFIFVNLFLFFFYCVLISFMYLTTMHCNVLELFGIFHTVVLVFLLLCSYLVILFRLLDILIALSE